MSLAAPIAPDLDQLLDDLVHRRLPDALWLGEGPGDGQSRSLGTLGGRRIPEPVVLAAELVLGAVGHDVA